jgi:hypothetical protein
MSGCVWLERSAVESDTDELPNAIIGPFLVFLSREHAGDKSQSEASHRQSGKSFQVSRNGDIHVTDCAGFEIDQNLPGSGEKAEKSRPQQVEVEMRALLVLVNASRKISWSGESDNSDSDDGWLYFRWIHTSCVGFKWFLASGQDSEEHQEAFPAASGRIAAAPVESSPQHQDTLPQQRDASR